MAEENPDIRISWPGSVADCLVEVGGDELQDVIEAAREKSQSNGDMLWAKDNEVDPRPIALSDIKDVASSAHQLQLTCCVSATKSDEKELHVFSLVGKAGVCVVLVEDLRRWQQSRCQQGTVEILQNWSV